MITNANVLNVLNTLEVRNTANVGGFPLRPNDVLVFVPQANLIVEHPAQQGINAWTGLLAINGVEVSISQLLRRNNGLRLQGTTPTERLRAFFQLGDENGQVRIQVVEDFSRDGRHYYRFAVTQPAQVAQPAQPVQPVAY